MFKGLWRWLIAAAIISAGVIGASSFAVAGGGSRGGDGDTPSLAGGAQPLEESEESERRRREDMMHLGGIARARCAGRRQQARPRDPDEGVRGERTSRRSWRAASHDEV